ncbi:MAG: FAD-binding oxidoreductase [Pseudomonadota bacterium]
MRAQPEVKTEPFWHDAAPPEAALAVVDLPARVDVVVIGAGFTGLSAARRLAQAGRSVIVLDAGRPGDGASSRNGGMIGWGHRASLDGLAKRYGEEVARAVLTEARASYDFTTGLIAEERIECDLLITGRFLAAASPLHYERLAREAEAARQAAGLEIEVLSRTDQTQEIVTTAYHGGLLMPTHGGLHPAKFHRGLLAAARRAGAEVIGHTPVTAIDRLGPTGFRIGTSRGTIEARDVAVATNGYSGFHGKALRPFAERLVPLPSFILATEPLGENRIRALMPGGRMYVETRSTHAYFRADPSGQRILWGGRASLNPISPERALPRLRGQMLSIFPELEDVAITHSWTGRIAYTRDSIPHIGRHEGLWFACGYCGSGVAMAPYLGWRMAEKILGGDGARTGFDATRFNRVPFYRGLPLVLSGMELWHKAKDWREGVRPAKR